MKNYHVVCIALLAVAIASLAACDVRAAGGQVVTKFDCDGREVSFNPDGAVVLDGMVYPAEVIDQSKVGDGWVIRRFGEQGLRVVLATVRDTGETYLGVGHPGEDVVGQYCKPVEFSQLDAVK